MKRQFLFATLMPIGFMILLFLLVGNAAIKTTAFKRNYTSNILQEERSIANKGLYQLREYKGLLYGTDFRSIYQIEFPTMEKKVLAPAMSQPVVGWGFQDDSLFTCLANQKTLYCINKDQLYDEYHHFDFTVLKMFVINDSILLLKAHDTAFTHQEFYAWNRHTKKIEKLKDGLIKYRDGGFSTDGEFAKEDDQIVHFQCNMGKFSVINALDFEFSPNYVTVDRQIMPPPVVQFSHNGFRLDKKFKKINLAAYVRNNKLFLLSNAYNKMEFYSAVYKNEYPIDVYDLKTGGYQYSFSVPKKDYGYGSLISVMDFKQHLILLYLRRILIMRYEDQSSQYQ